MDEPYNDPYEVLGVARGATAADIKRAYFALVRIYPPEREPEMFKRVRTAYEQLRDPAARLETDMLLLDRWPALARRRRAPKADLEIQPADVLRALRTLSDLERTDWRAHYAKVKL